MDGVGSPVHLKRRIPSTWPKPDFLSALHKFPNSPGGHFGLTDLTRNGALPPELDGLLAWVACIADALPVVTYATQFTAAGLIDLIEEHDAVLAELVQRIRGRLVGAELLIKLKHLPMPHDGLDFNHAKALAHRVVDAVRTGTLGYTLMIASKPGGVSTAR